MDITSMIPDSFLHTGLAITIIIILIFSYYFYNTSDYFRRLVPVALYSSIASVGILYFYNLKLEAKYKKLIEAEAAKYIKRFPVQESITPYGYSGLIAKEQVVPELGQAQQ